MPVERETHQTLLALPSPLSTVVMGYWTVYWTHFTAFSKYLYDIYSIYNLFHNYFLFPCLCIDIILSLFAHVIKAINY